MKENIIIAKKVTNVSIIGNIVLSALKIIFGIYGKSSALIADGIHSVSDVFTSIIAYFGVKFSIKEDDKDHPYGHEKIELVVSKILAIILILTGIFIAKEAVTVIQENKFHMPKKITLIAVGISIVFKEWMYHYTIKGALKINSNSLKADAWHHRSDALSSVAAMVGIIGALNGILVLEPIASILIAGFVLKIGVEIYVDSVKGLIDTSASPDVLNKIREVVLSIDGVIGIDLLKTRLHGNKIYVDIEISADGDLPLRKSHKVAEKVHLAVEDNINGVKHCMVHVNPEDKI